MFAAAPSHEYAFAAMFAALSPDEQERFLAESHQIVRQERLAQAVPAVARALPVAVPA